MIGIGTTATASRQRRRSRALCAALSSALAAGCGIASEIGAELDASRPVVDAGGGSRDAGAGRCDAASDSNDAALTDAGGGTSDAGANANDALSDGGSPANDAGLDWGDAGSGSNDAGAFVDAGKSPDTGAGQDGGLPAGYVFCCYQEQRCGFLGMQTVAYGALGAFVFKQATDGIDCDDAAFGVSADGAKRECYIPGAPAGHVAYTLVKVANPTSEQQNAYAKISDAMDKAVSFYNKYTTITKALTILYEPSVSTADGNINGTIRFGANTSYMHETTAMHEIAHAVGVGQSGGWFRLSVGGVFTGERATSLMRAITGQPSDVLHGDSQHFWPYGLNYQSEVKSDTDYVNHCKIVEAMKADGI